jgi:hypothetical protein
MSAKKNPNPGDAPRRKGVVTPAELHKCADGLRDLAADFDRAVEELAKHKLTEITMTGWDKKNRALALLADSLRYVGIAIADAQRRRALGIDRV